LPQREKPFAVLEATRQRIILNLFFDEFLNTPAEIWSLLNVLNTSVRLQAACVYMLCRMSPCERGYAWN